MRNLSEIIDLIRLHKNVRSDGEVADFLKIKPKTLASSKTRNSIPYEELTAFCSEEDLSLSWLLTGQGWAFNPSSSGQAMEWLIEKVERVDIQKILIASYYDGLAGCANGFILNTEYGAISMEGGSTRSGYLGGGPKAYRKILEAIKAKNLPVFVRRFKENETPAWDRMDLSELLLSPDIENLDIDAELRMLRPDIYAEEKPLEKELPLKHVEDERLAGLIKKLERIYLEGGRETKAWVRGVIEEAYDGIIAEAGKKKNGTS